MAQEIQRILVISTGNLSFKTREALTAGAVKIIGLDWEYGWWVWINEPDRDGTLPTDLAAAVQLARQSDCQWVRFDADGDLAEGLTDYSEETE